MSGAAEISAPRQGQKQVAEYHWGVVQPVGHLTVNEDGEGSNPSAPANSIESALFIFRFSNKSQLSNN